ncbi:alpha/beta hydrolase fold domain-containing protein, partial [Frankia sp. AgB32]|nr:alpha/beta hydrolase fold domain-containing protein [Frankia sp. AgB32]
MTAGTPVPFDAELGAVLQAVGDHVPRSMTAEQIPLFRQLISGAAPSEEELSAGGAFTIETVTAPGEPDVSLLVGRPANLREPAAAIYYMHGGGMVFGDARTGVHEPLDWAAELGLVVVAPDYRL